jgi:hypothetical protein
MTKLELRMPRQRDDWRIVGVFVVGLVLGLLWGLGV